MEGGEQDSCQSPAQWRLVEPLSPSRGLGGDVGGEPFPPLGRRRLLTDSGERPPIIHAQAAVHQGRARSCSWDAAARKRARRRATARQDSSSSLYFNFLTETSFNIDKDHRVHIPDDENSTFEEESAESQGLFDEVNDEGLRLRDGKEEKNKTFVNGHHKDELYVETRDLKESAPLLSRQGSRESAKSAFSCGIGRESFTHGAASPGFSFKKFWLYCGPGWLMSVAYLDPGNIESDLQAGAFYGFQLLWVLTVATLLGFFFQCLAIRLGVVLNRNLAEVCREHFGSTDSKILFAMMQLAVIGSDCQELLGSAIAFRVLFGIPLWLGCFLTGIDTLTFLGLHIIGVRQLELFFVVLIGIMVTCFVGTFLSDPAHPADIAHGLFVPKLQKEATVQAVSILGAVVMPHNIFLHSALVLSRDIDRSRPHKISEANYYFSIEAGLALFVSLLINIAVVSVFAHGFFSDTCNAVQTSLHLSPGNAKVDPPLACVPLGEASHQQHSGIECVTQGGVEGSCMPIGLQGAASALEAFVGKAASVVWSIGLLAAGQSSTMTGTYAGQFIMEGFLELRIPNWVRVAITRAVSLVPALFVAVLANSNYLAADKLDELLNVLQSLQLPFALFPVLYFTGSQEYMGDFVNSRHMQVLGLSVCAMVIGLNVYLVFNRMDVTGIGIWTAVAISIYAVIYLYAIGRVVKAFWIPRPDFPGLGKKLVVAKETSRKSSDVSFGSLD